MQDALGFTVICRLEVTPSQRLCGLSHSTFHGQPEAFILRRPNDANASSTNPPRRDITDSPRASHRTPRGLFRPSLRTPRPVVPKPPSSHLAGPPIRHVTLLSLKALCVHCPLLTQGRAVRGVPEKYCCTETSRAYGLHPSSSLSIRVRTHTSLAHIHGCIHGALLHARNAHTCAHTHTPTLAHTHRHTCSRKALHTGPHTRTGMYTSLHNINTRTQRCAAPSHADTQSPHEP